MKDGKLEFKDAPMFGRVMRNPEICKGVLERILGFEIDHVEYLNTEHTLDPATFAKGVRLDVFAKGCGRVYDVEMQATNKLGLGKRLRYYQASIDQACLDKGEDYDELDESYIVFVCDFDSFGQGFSLYRFERRCLEDESVQAGDESHWLVLNASAWEAEADEGRAEVLRYIHTNEVTDDNIMQQIDREVRKVNNDAEWRERAMGFMTIEHDHRVQMRAARKEGLEQGLEQGQTLYAALVDKLLDQKRFEDLKRSAEDPAFRQSLFEEFHIS